MYNDYIQVKVKLFFEGCLWVYTLNADEIILGPLAPKMIIML